MYDFRVLYLNETLEVTTEIIVFCLSRKKRKDILKKGKSTGDKRALVLSVNSENVLDRCLGNYNVSLEETRGDGNCF